MRCVGTKASVCPHSEGMPLVELRGIEAGYGRHVVLRGLDMAVRRGEFLALVGDNGAGKTTARFTVWGYLIFLVWALITAVFSPGAWVLVVLGLVAAFSALFCADGLQLLRRPRFWLLIASALLLSPFFIGEKDVTLWGVATVAAGLPGRAADDGAGAEHRTGGQRLHWSCLGGRIGRLPGRRGAEGIGLRSGALLALALLSLGLALLLVTSGGRMWEG